MRVFFLTICMVGCLVPTVFAQLNIKRASSTITIDGVMDEKAWEEVDVADQFNQFFPLIPPRQ